MPELHQESISVRKIHLDINHEAAIGILTENQSALHYRDSIEADARLTFNIRTNTPISIQERNFLISPQNVKRNRKQFTSGLVIVEYVKYIDATKTLCEIYGFDLEQIRKREYIPKASRVILPTRTGSRPRDPHENTKKTCTKVTSVDTSWPLPSYLKSSDQENSSSFKISSALDSLNQNIKSSVVHSRNRNAKGTVILKVYKNMLAQALEIGETLMLAL